MFVFLCGANIKDKGPSKRRQALIDFSRKQLTNTKFFVAEKIFEFLLSEGHRENSLDLEKQLFNLADKVIIILESESAFCELGAFSYPKEFREKIIVVNDRNYETSTSFINTGPISAIQELTGDDNILYYKMDKYGITEGDGIGDIYSKLSELLSPMTKKKRSKVGSFDPNSNFSQDSIKFVHDLVYFTSPIKTVELLEVIKILFGNFRQDQLKKHLSLLFALNQVNKSADGYFTSTQGKLFFDYLFNLDSLITAFRNMYLKSDPKRYTLC